MPQANDHAVIETSRPFRLGQATPAWPAAATTRPHVLLRSSYASGKSAAGEFRCCWDGGCGPVVNGADDLAVVDPAQINDGDRQVRVPELLLDDQQRDPFA